MDFLCLAKNKFGGERVCWNLGFISIFLDFVAHLYFQVEATFNDMRLLMPLRLFLFHVIMCIGHTFHLPSIYTQSQRITRLLFNQSKHFR